MSEKKKKRKRREKEILNEIKIVKTENQIWKFINKERERYKE